MRDDVPSAGEQYVPRVVDEELRALMAGVPAVCIEGPKAVGKTVTARRLARTEHDLDNPAMLELVRADPATVVRGDEPVLIDEWQRVPSSWDLVRRSVDANARPGRFLLTGSASLESPGTHSGAGRIVTVHMRPMSSYERGLASPAVSLAALLSGRRAAVSGATDVSLGQYADEIVRGGFPGLRRGSERIRRVALDGYLRRVVDRDIAEAGRAIRNPAALDAWLRAYAAASSTTASYETIRDAATSGQRDKPAKSTTAPYRDALARLWIVDPVPAWLPSRRHLTRLNVGPKHQLADPALAARLLHVGTEALLAGDDGTARVPRDGTLLGALFESLVTLDVRVYAQAADAAVAHLRTQNGAREVDLVVIRDDQRVLAVEVKLSATIGDHDVRHLRWLQEQIADDLLDAVVITTGRFAYRRPDGIAVVPAALLGP